MEQMYSFLSLILAGGSSPSQEDVSLPPNLQTVVCRACKRLFAGFSAEPASVLGGAWQMAVCQTLNASSPAGWRTLGPCSVTATGPYLRCDNHKDLFVDITNDRLWDFGLTPHQCWTEFNKRSFVKL